MCATVHKAGFSVDVPEGWIATNEERVSSNLAPLPDAELWVGARSAAGDDDRPQMYGIIRFPTTARSAVGLEAAVRARLANGPPSMTDVRRHIVDLPAGQAVEVEYELLGSDEADEGTGLPMLEWHFLHGDWDVMLFFEGDGIAPDQQEAIANSLEFAATPIDTPADAK